jgi:hypothetical protein
VSLVSIYDVPCPYCAAEPGRSCVAQPSGEKRLEPHVLRIRAFREAAK